MIHKEKTKSRKETVKTKFLSLGPKKEKEKEKTS